jgi:DNA polymerase III epsilon subunit-like protein
MIHTMIDLETLGTRPGCAIFSLGAVKFDPDIGQQGPTFYSVIHLKSCYDVGLRADPDTVYWWLGQSKEAQAALFENRITLAATLANFHGYFQGSERVWSHGATFDVPILEAAYFALKGKPPWTYKQARDTRTLFDLAGPFERTKPEIPHHALYDAVAQAKDVCTAWKIVKGRK